MIALASFMIGLIAAAGQFLDFLLGREGQKRIKGRLVELYVVLNEHSWDEIGVRLAQAFQAFMASALRANKGALAFTLRIALISGTLTIFNVTAHYVRSSPVTINGERVTNVKPFWKDQDELVTLSAVLITNVCVDVVSWLVLIILLRRVVNGAAPLWVAIIGSVIHGYVSLLIVKGVATFFAILSISFRDGQPLSYLYSSAWDYAGPAGVIDPFGHSFVFSERINNISSLYTTVLIPHALFCTLYLAVIALRYGESALRAPVSLILQRAEESRHSVFTIASGCASGLVALITLFRTAFLRQ